MSPTCRFAFFTSVIALGVDSFCIQWRSSFRLPTENMRTSGRFSIATIENDDGPFEFSLLEPYWQQDPVLIRQAFDLNDENSWPFFSWDDVLNLAMDERSDEAARLIRHIPGQLNSFDLQLAPFEKTVERDFDKFNRKQTNNRKSYKQTLLVNDVDRYVPALADWMDDCFGQSPHQFSLPRWRRDDAQVSLAHTGGGIGPHVDQYDVLLIQVSGQREWLIDANHRLTTQEEMDQLIPDLSVRILRPSTKTGDGKEDRYTRIVLEPGDCLYLPPRVVHWGTAVSDQCITLSVGFRAPSACDLVSQIAETLTHCASEAANRRYTDSATFTNDKFTPGKAPSIDSSVKDRMKQLVLDAVQETMDDDMVWDEIVGKLVTNPMRYSENLDWEPLDEASAKECVSKVEEGRGTLRRAPGISFATSRIATGDENHCDRLFAAGQVWETENDEDAVHMFSLVENGTFVDREMLSKASNQLKQRLVEMLVEGVILYLA